MSSRRTIIYLAALGALSLGSAKAFAQVTSSIRETEIILQSPDLRIVYHAKTGRMDATWRDGSKLTGIESGAKLANGDSLLSSGYATHRLAQQPAQPSQRGEAVFTITSTSAGKPTLLQHIILSEHGPWFSITAELDRDAAAIGTRHFDAVILHGKDAIHLAHGANQRLLHVPFDNDMWFRFKSEPVSEMQPGDLFTSDEVTAVYDNDTRDAVVLGSIDHSTWKTAIEARAEGGAITGLDAYGGISSPTGVRTDTHDTVAHGMVHGERVVSPRIFIGAFSDWRDGLEAYGQANARVQPPLPWGGPVPMGWNSWAAYGAKIDYQRYLGAAQFLRDILVPQGFSRNQVVYVNLDAFWSRLDAVQLADAVKNIRAMHTADGTRFEPGIYWTPFAYWSDDLDAWVEGTGMKYRYRDILLKAPDGSFLPKVDGGRAIDPSHPGSQARVSYFLKKFHEMGFSYLKLDFLSHGALEGMHYDPKIQTGIQAYNQGMKQIADENANRMFLSLSIAPLFPSGYGHARRLSCDTKGHISGAEQSTEYMLNSLTYGWWTNRNLYIADPDHVVLGEKADQGARSVEEGTSRLLSAIITSGMILDSSRLADDPQGRDLAEKIYSNRRLLAVAKQQRTFRPIEGDSGDKATPAFVAASPRGFYVAVFNYDDAKPREITIPLDRIAPSLANAPSVDVTDVESGRQADTIHGNIAIHLDPAQSKLLELSAGDTATHPRR
jgi:alpha-galactosidase